MVAQAAASLLAGGQILLTAWPWGQVQGGTGKTQLLLLSVGFFAWWCDPCVLTAGCLWQARRGPRFSMGMAPHGATAVPSRCCGRVGEAAALRRTAFCRRSVTRGMYEGKCQHAQQAEVGEPGCDGVSCRPGRCLPRRV
jgi:hypothetical protein